MRNLEVSELTDKEILSKLVCLDEACKRLRTKDYRDSSEKDLLTSTSKELREELVFLGPKYSELIRLAEAGKFCPLLARNLERLTGG